MAGSLYTPTFVQAGDSNANPLSGAKLYFYTTGTSTPASVYTTPAMNVAHTSPVVANSSGRFAPIYLDPNVTYRVVLTTSADVAVPNGEVDPFTSVASDFAGSGGSALLGFLQSGTAPVARTVQSKLREVKSFEDWFPTGKTIATMTTAETYSALQSAVTSALANGHDLFHPGGTYNIGQNYFPLRQAGVNPATLLDCGGLTIYGVGPNSVFKNEAPVDGQDLFQLNGLDNLNLRDFACTATPYSGTPTNGSNGISLTGGYDRITIENVWVYDMRSVDVTTNIDGGAAVTVQCDTAVAEVGSLLVRGLHAANCSYAFAFQADADAFLTKRTAVDVEVFADSCFAAVSLGGLAPSATVPAGTHAGIRVKAQALNCQKDVQLTRIHGVQVECQVITTKLAEPRRQNAAGTPWFAADGTVEALFCAYAKNSQISVVGDKGACDFKARIGGATPGSSGQNGATQHCDIFLDVGGTAATSDVTAIDSGGNVISNSRIVCTTTTATTLPDDFYLPSRANDVEPGSLNVGSFTVTLTGVTGSVTGTAKWSLSDDAVTLELPNLSGTSNSTTATITGIPAFLRPTTAQGQIATVVDNGVAAIGRAQVETSGAVTLYVGAATAFTGSGTKGLQFSTLGYRRS